MSASGAIRAGAAYVEIFLEQGRITRDLASVQAKLRGWSASLSRIGSSAYGGALPGPLGAIAGVAASPAGAMTGLLMAAKSAADFGTELDILSQKTGLSHEVIAGLDYAAKQSGVSTELLGTGIRQLAKNTYAAASGSKEQADAFRQLGVDAASFLKLAPDEQFRIMADRLKAVENPTLRAALAMRVFGRSGVDLMPLIDEGADGIARLQEMARSLGLTMGGQEAKRLREFGDRVDDLLMVMKRGAAAIGSALTPRLSEMAVSFGRGLKAVRQWIDAHGELLTRMLQVAAAITAVGVATKAMSVGISFAAGGVGLLTGLVNPTNLLAITLGAVAVAFTNAQMKGISFGESVLDLTNKLTGLENAYSRLQSKMDSGKAIGAPTQMFEKGMREGSLSQTADAIKQMDANKNRIAAELQSLKKKRDADQREYSRTGGFNYAAGARRDAADPLIAQKAMELKQAEILLSRYRQIQNGLFVKQAMISPLAAVLRGVNYLGIGLSAGKSFAQGFVDSAKSRIQALASAMWELQTLRAEGIADPQKREEALANVKYDSEAAKIRQDNKAPEMLAANEAQRQQAIANIRAKYAREAAEKEASESQRITEQRKEAEERTAEEIARLQIETTKTGIDKERALLELKHQEELKRAQELGMNVDLVRRKQALEGRALSMTSLPGVAAQAKGDVEGTFSGYALGGLGGGGGVQEKIEKHLAKMNEKADRTNAALERIERNANNGISLA